MNEYLTKLEKARTRQAIRALQLGSQGEHYSDGAEGIKSEGSELYIFGDIVTERWFYEDVTPMMVKEAIDKSGETVTVHINSYGGETAAGLAVYNLLKHSGKEVKTVNDGFACSSASIVFMAGGARVMSEASLLMIHNAWTFAIGNAAELRKTADDLETISETSANAYLASINIESEKLKKLMDAETWISPGDALLWGFATDIDGELYSSAVPEPGEDGDEGESGSGKEPQNNYQKFFSFRKENNK